MPQLNRCSHGVGKICIDKIIAICIKSRTAIFIFQFEKQTGNLQGTLTAVERELIQDALKLTNGNISSAAKKLEISERIIGLRIRKYKINPARYK